MNKNSLTDTHFHLELSDDIPEIIKLAHEKNVCNLIMSACSLKDIKEALEIINKYPDIYLTIGIHPDSIEDFNDTTISYLSNLVKNNSKIIGIGEIGLDYYHNKDNKKDQQEIFKKQLDLAVKLDLPVVIHTREAFLDTYNILKDYKLKGIIHCFSGPIENALKYIDLGYLLGIGGVSTFKNSKLPSVLENIDLKHLVLETDSPYLSPEPVRSLKNNPSNISIICSNLAKIKNDTFEHVMIVTTSNALNLFKKVK